MNTTKATATQIATGCNCGCGEATGRNAMYRPGHDARHVSTLLQGLVNEHADGRPVTKTLINQVAKELPSEPLQAKFRRAAERFVAKIAAEAKADAEVAK